LALIALFKERSGLLATAEILSEYAPASKPKQIAKVLDDLTAWSLVIFKRHLGAYAIYAGSDFDVDQALEEALADIKGIDFKTLRPIACFQPIIAKRHYHEIGALRWLDVDLVPLSSLLEIVSEYEPAHGAMGIFLVPIPTEGESEATLKRLCQKAPDLRNDIDIIVGHSPHAARVVELAREVLALSQIQHERPELQGDNVARRELLARLAEAQDQLERLLAQILDGATWYRHGSKQQPYSGVVLNELASEIADKRFNQTPRVFNELLNRLKPSSNANAAQKTLVQAMVSKEGEPRLGIEGFPAEGGLFASTLEKTGLYRETGDGWRFVGPDVDSDAANIAPLWKRADELLQTGSGRLIGLGELYAAWRARPYGLKDGLMPIFAVAYIRSRRDNLAFYRQNIFQARFTDLDIDYLFRDARDIQLRWLDIRGATQRLLFGMADVVQELDERQPCIALKPIDIARGLVAVYEKVEPWTKRTNRLSAEAIRIRDIFRHASDPNRLLLDDLPALVGANTDLSNKTQLANTVSAVRNGLVELQQSYRKMLDELRWLLLKELQVLDASESLAALRERAENVRDVSGDFRLNAFVGRIAQFERTDADIEAIASLAANKPPRDWADPDIDRATIEIADLAQKFIRTELFARVKGRAQKRDAMAVVIGLNGRPSPLLEEFAVAEADRAEINDLISRVSQAVEQADTRRSIILAALAELSARYMQPAGDASTERGDVSAR
jgi:hypothetical protein